MRIDFRINAEPHPKGRPRFAKRGKFVSTYTDEKTKAFEKLVAESVKDVQIRLCGPVKLSVLFLHKRVGRLGKGGREWAHTCPKDCDNIIKSVLDGLQVHAVTDDKQVVIIEARQQYAADNEEPHIVGYLEEISHKI